MRACLIILGIGVLLMSGCAGAPATTPSSTAASVQPLQSPNGARPAFLAARGDAVMATRDSGEYMPAPGAVYPAFSLEGSLAGPDSVVVHFAKTGAGNRYWVYVRYERV